MDLTHVRFQGVPASIASTRSARTAEPFPEPAPADRLDPDPARSLPSWVLTRAGLDPRLYRRAPLERRIAPCLRALKVDSDDAARLAIHRDRARLHVALNALLIGLSGFFRDAHVFDLMTSAVVPALGARTGPIRVWSVGCSNGAELYSVAILLAEAGLLGSAFLLGTDCREDAIAEARTGRFAPAALSAVPAALLDKYFVRTGGGRRIASSIAQRIVWRQGDATQRIETGPWDLVLCRNLVIYVQTDVAHAIFRRIADTLAPEGFLVVGKAERPPAGCRLTAIGRSVHRRHAD